mmetsp:Transcript_36890/g.48881  ORF Transcript_36890/g.48881 Transcript_36890/m.48881 type:complete len:122 (+) Transcript_36890:66-431(+)
MKLSVIFVSLCVAIALAVVEGTIVCTPNGGLLWVQNPAELCRVSYGFTIPRRLVPYSCSSGARAACCSGTSDGEISPGQGLGTCKPGIGRNPLTSGAISSTGGYAKTIIATLVVAAAILMS